MVWDVRNLLNRRTSSRSQFKRSNSYDRLVQSRTNIPVSDESCAIRIEEESKKGGESSSEEEEESSEEMECMMMWDDDI